MSVYKYEQIAELVKSCQACPLAFRGVGVPGEYVHHKERNAFGVLDPSRVMVILEAPGGTEQDIGRPVVGNSGKLFRSLMDECGVHSYYVTNVAKHRPLVKKGKQQPPDAVTVTACSGFLDAEIMMIQPQKIILCGNAAASRILGVPGNMAQKDLVNRVYDIEIEGAPVKVLVLYHPAYFLHNRTAAFVNKEVNDWKRALRNFMGAEIPHYPIEEVKCNAHG